LWLKRIAIIPSRLQSTRLPHKPLVMLEGKTLIYRVCRRTLESGLFDEVICATDSQAIFEQAQLAGAIGAMTGHHSNGTERVAAAAMQLELNANDFVVNVQGDEPFVAKQHLEAVLNKLEEGAAIATLMKPIHSWEELTSPSTAKVVFNEKQEALYFSRSPIPFLRNYPMEDWLNQHKFYRHLGLYGFQNHILQAVSSLTPGALEQAESLEQLRWLAHGYCIGLAETLEEAIAIDTPDDLERARMFLQAHPEMI